MSRRLRLLCVVMWCASNVIIFLGGHGCLPFGVLVLAPFFGLFRNASSGGLLIFVAAAMSWTCLAYGAFRSGKVGRRVIAFLGAIVLISSASVGLAWNSDRPMFTAVSGVPSVIVGVWGMSYLFCQRRWLLK